MNKSEKKINIKQKSNGGFPPLRLIKQQQDTQQINNKERLFSSTTKSNINITQLLNTPSINTFVINKKNDTLEIVD